MLIFSCFITFKYGEIHELHKVRACFEEALKKQENYKGLFTPGIEMAENIVDNLVDDELKRI